MGSSEQIRQPVFSMGSENIDAVSTMAFFTRW